MTQPLVSIGIPTVSRLEYLIEAVESALAQTWPSLELIIGDDGDSAELRDWCVRRSVTDGRVKYQRNPRRLGLAGNWNAIAARASGEFIALPGDDDRLMPAFVDRLMAAAAPDSAAIFSNHHIIDGDGRRLSDETERTERQYHRVALATGRVPDASVCAWQLAICPSAVLVRRTEAIRLRFREELNSPDVEFFIRLAGEGKRFDFVAERLAEVRRHDRGTATSSGLRHDALVARLVPIAVPAHIEQFKHALIEQLIVNAVSRCLQQGSVRLAKVLLQSEYYPRSSRRVSRLVQQICAGLPESVGSRVYRAIAAAKRRGRLPANLRGDMAL